MTTDSVRNLLNVMTIHWPSLKKDYVDPNTGKFSEYVIREWYNRLGPFDDKEIDDLLNAYLANTGSNKYPPRIGYFLGSMNETSRRRAPQGYQAAEDRRNRKYAVVKVRSTFELQDDTGRIYADPDDPYGTFYVNKSGRICKQNPANGKEEVWF